MAKEWTKGPWMTAAKPSSVVGWPVVSQEGRAIALLNYVHHSAIDLPVAGDRAFNSESKANGALIAAAPTMADYIESRARAGDEQASKIWESINAD